jgi:hypothetical protein
VRGVAAMPFKAYGAFFKPDELDILNDAYDAAWQHVRSRSGAMTPSQATDLKNRLAKMILASACTGERGRERLAEIALRGVSGGGSATEKKPPSRKAAHADRN